MGKVTRDQAAGAAHLQRILGGGGLGGGVGVGAKRVAGSGVGVGAVASSLFSGGDATTMADGGVGGAAELEVGEHKRARLAGGHLKHVLLVFEGDLDTCDRGVIRFVLRCVRVRASECACVGLCVCV